MTPDWVRTGGAYAVFLGFEDIDGCLCACFCVTLGEGDHEEERRYVFVGFDPELWWPYGVDDPGLEEWFPGTAQECKDFVDTIEMDALGELRRARAAAQVAAFDERHAKRTRFRWWWWRWRR